ncbi:MAG: hypothetical protein V8T12_04195 [Parabacteroides johnsonii]
MENDLEPAGQQWLDIPGTAAGVGGLWAMMDSMLVSWYIYRQPLGFDITNVYKINIGKKSAGIPGYQPDSLLATSEGEDLIRLVENIRRAEEVDEICVASTSCPTPGATCGRNGCGRMPIRA